MWSVIFVLVSNKVILALVHPCISLQTPPQKSRQIDLKAQRSAVLGLGCFWEPSESLTKVHGIRNTRVGYAGGKPNPTYRSVCGGDGNVEVVKVIYDDDIISYEQVLDASLEIAKPGQKRQYLPLIFAADDDEQFCAQQWCDKESMREDGLKSSDFRVERASTFYLAEEYHQEYWQKQRPRFALLASFVVIQTFAPSDSFLSSPEMNRAITIITQVIAAFFILERLFNVQVREEPLASLPSLLERKR